MDKKELNNEELENTNGGVDQDCRTTSGDTPIYKVGDIVYYLGKIKARCQVIEVSTSKEVVVWGVFSSSAQRRYKVHYLDNNDKDEWLYEYQCENKGYRK